MLLQTAGPQGTRRIENEKARFTLIFVAADEDHHGEGKPGQAEVELTYNWPPEDGRLVETYTGGRNFGHLAYRVEDIYETCARLQWTCLGKVESSLEVKGELNDEAATVHEGV